MSIIEWQPNFSVGVEALDLQHQRILAMINLLVVSLDTDCEKKVVMKVLSDLAGYTKTHFAAEERLLEQQGYPDLETHREQHHALNRQLAEIYHRFYTSKQFQANELKVLMQSWFSDHILKDDLSYAPYMADGQTLQADSNRSEIQ